jgi:hypothetical protein
LPPALLPVFPAHKLALDFYRILSSKGIYSLTLFIIPAAMG